MVSLTLFLNNKLIVAFDYLRNKHYNSWRNLFTFNNDFVYIELENLGVFCCCLYVCEVMQVGSLLVRSLLMYCAVSLRPTSSRSYRSS